MKLFSFQSIRSLLAHRGVLWITLLAVALFLATACEDNAPRRMHLFDRAENHFQRGDYDAALDEYQAFLQRYPQSPLSKTVKLRIRCINREVKSLMARKDMPKPEYVADPSDE